MIGRHAAAFEDLYRDEWMPALAEGDDARLVWYLNHAMGSGPAYQVVTVTAFVGRIRLGGAGPAHARR